MEVTFHWSLDDEPTAFALQTSKVPHTGYSDDATAVITKLSPGLFEATIPVPASTPEQFYRVRYLTP